jgi:hypothetical protein
LYSFLGINWAIIKLKQLTQLLFLYVVTFVTPPIASYQSSIFVAQKEENLGWLSHHSAHGAENGRTRKKIIHTSIPIAFR